MTQNKLALMLLMFITILSGCSTNSHFIPPVDDQAMKSLLWNDGIPIPTISVKKYRELHYSYSLYSEYCKREEKQICSERWVQNVISWGRKGYNIQKLLELRKLQMQMYPSVR